MPFFNYTVHAHDLSTAGYWPRREFLRAWWSLYRDDSRWTPPHYGRLRAALNPAANDHLARLSATLLHVDALHRTGLRRSRTDQQEIPLTSIVEYPLAAAVLLIDPRRRGRTAHLALPHFANDAEAFDRLCSRLVELLADANYRRVVGPVGLSPHLGAGLLVDGWNEPAPLHTPSNPPYTPELVERRWRPLQEGRLYRADIATLLPDEPSGPAVIRPFDPARLAGDLLPLLVAATENPTAAFPPPDAAEAAFLLRQLPDPVVGLLAEVDGEAAGFLLLGADTGAWLRATRGSRSLWRRGLWGVSSRVAPAGGRVFFGAVRPEWRGRGIGGQLWARGLRVAAGRGWRTLTVGPVWLPPVGASPAVAFLAGRAAARQVYRLYEWSF